MAARTKRNEEPDYPTPGSLPGLRQGMNIFTRWATMLGQHADAYNSAWSALRSGSFEVRDVFSTLGYLVDTTAAAVQFSLESLTGPSAPPWVAIQWPLREELLVRVKLPVDRGHEFNEAPLSALGAATKSALIATAQFAGGNQLKITLEKVGPEPKPGSTYIGFIFSSQYSDPLLVLMVSVPEEDDGGGTPPKKKRARKAAAAPEEEPAPVRKARKKAKKKAK